VCDLETSRMGAPYIYIYIYIYIYDISHLRVKQSQHNIKTIKILLPTDEQNNWFKRILKFTLKQLKHVSV